MFGLFENANHLSQNLKFVPRLRKLQLAPSDHAVVFRENKTALWRYSKKYTMKSALDSSRKTNPPKQNPIPILIVPSLINRHYILDLLPEKSLIAYLRDQNLQTYLLNWGTPGDEDRDLGLKEYVNRYLHRAVEKTCRDAGSDQVLLLGHCLGGTLTTLYTALNPKYVAGLANITAPINFHNSSLLSKWCQAQSFDLNLLLEAQGNMPWAVLQSTFLSQRPTTNTSKWIQFSKKINDPEFVDSFLALEVWSNDNVSFAGKCYQEIINLFYKNNSLVKNEFMFHGQKVALKNITAPVLNVSTSEDHIVPLDATQVLTKLTSSKDTTDIVVSGGHVGGIVGKHARKTLWPELALWLAKQQPSDLQTPSYFAQPSSFDHKGQEPHPTLDQ